MAKKILIVGGGLAGTIIANGLCRQLGTELRANEVTITVIGNTEQHMYQPGLLYIPFGRIREKELFRDQSSVLDRRITFHVDPATKIDIASKSVVTESGTTFDYDYLVLATGSRLRPDTIPGMTEGAHWFYDLDGARKMREALDEFDGGKIVVMWDKTEITYTYPIGRLHSLEPVANWTQPEFDKAGIKYETYFNTKSVDAEKKIISSEEESDLEYDLLVTIPPHHGAQVISDSDLGAGGWVPTNKETLLHEGTTDVFVCGDTTNIPISKAGSTAHFEADTIIDNLTSLVTEGRMAVKYDGKVFCFVETGLHEGTYVWFNYNTPPNPGPPSQMVHWFKLAYNRLYWLSARGLL